MHVSIYMCICIYIYIYIDISDLHNHLLEGTLEIATVLELRRRFPVQRGGGGVWNRSSQMPEEPLSPGARRRSRTLPNLSHPAHLPSVRPRQSRDEATQSTIGHKRTSAQAHKRTSAQAHKSTRAQEHKSTRAQAQRNTNTSTAQHKPKRRSTSLFGDLLIGWLPRAR